MSSLFDRTLFVPASSSLFLCHFPTVGRSPQVICLRLITHGPLPLALTSGFVRALFSERFLLIIHLLSDSCVSLLSGTCVSFIVLTNCFFCRANSKHGSMRRILKPSQRPRPLLIGSISSVSS